MSTLKADAVTAQTTNGNIDITGNGTGKVRLGDGNLIVPDADAAAGQVLTTDGSANLTFAATPGTSGNVLTSNGSAWTSAAAAAGGAWTAMATFDFADSAATDFTFTGMDGSANRAYCLVLSNVASSTTDFQLTWQVGTSGGIITSSDYEYHVSSLKANAGTYASDNSASATSCKMNTTIIGGTTATGYSCALYIHLQDATSFTLAHGTQTFISDSPMTEGGTMVYAVETNSTIDRTKVTSTESLNLGYATLYKLGEA